MKRCSPFQMLVLLMAVLTFSLPFSRYTLAQAAQTKPIAQINKSFGADTNCLMPGIRTAPTENVPRILFAHRLLGKSPEYVANYAQNFQATTKRISKRTVTQGCVITGVVVVVGVIGMLWILSRVPTMG